MFGFVRPLKPELRVRELDRFQQVYCGLCATIKQRYGRLQTTFLSYDLTFFALLLSALEPQSPTVQNCHCVVHPIRKKPMQTADEVLNFTADLHVLLCYHKVQDSVADEKGWRKWLALATRTVTRTAYRKAVARHPALDTQLGACMRELCQIERAQVASLDQPADCFARMLACCIPPTCAQTTARVLQQLFYHLGRWIYLIDACYDVKEDMQTQSYNPVVLRFALTSPQFDQIREPLERTLERSLLDIYNAFQLLPIQRDGDLLANIITLGLPVTTAQVLDQTYQANGGQHGSL